VTTPLPSSCMSTVTVVSTLHPAAQTASASAHATRASRDRLAPGVCFS